MSDHPIFDSINAVHITAQRFGEMKGRQEMKDAVLKILRRSSKPSPMLVVMIHDIENLDVIGSDKHESA